MPPQAARCLVTCTGLMLLLSPLTAHASWASASVTVDGVTTTAQSSSTAEVRFEEGSIYTEPAQSEPREKHASRRQSAAATRHQSEVRSSGQQELPNASSGNSSTAPVDNETVPTPAEVPALPAAVAQAVGGEGIPPTTTAPAIEQSSGLAPLVLAAIGILVVDMAALLMIFFHQRFTKPNQLAQKRF